MNKLVVQFWSSLILGQMFSLHGEILIATIWMILAISIFIIDIYLTIKE